jgi:alkylhydroperoxidase family enzyme
VSRIDPIEKPYSAEHQKLFDLVMPEGMEPLELFRVMARSDRLLSRFMRGGVLDKGPVRSRDREIVIHRTTARCHAEYEWGVHVNAYGRPLGLGDAVLRATIDGDATDPHLDPRQSCLFQLCDDLHDEATVSDATWARLREFFDEMQILELIYTAGLYHMVSFLVNGLRLENEEMGATFDELRSIRNERP